MLSHYGIMLFYALNTHYGGTRCLSFWGLGQKDITLCIIIQFFTNEALRPKSPPPTASVQISLKFLKLSKFVETFWP